MLYKWGAGLGAHIDAYTPPRKNPSHHLLSSQPRNPSCARGASTPIHGVPSLYVWTPWRRYCICCCAGQLRQLGVAVTMTMRRQSWSITSSTLMCDYLGPLLQLFFRFSARLVVMIHSLLLTSFLGWHGRSSAGIAYPYPYTNGLEYFILPFYHGGMKVCLVVV
jgi:hypothetical protein